MHDLVIIGAGPAGLTAGLYAGRYRVSTLVLEKMVPGGQILLNERIENFPGFPGGIPTQELIDRMKRQLEELGVPVAIDEARGVTIDEKKGGRSFIVAGESSTYEARSLIIASGAHPKQLGVKGEEAFLGRGVSYCGTCDGPLFRNKEVLVIGGGNTAVEEAVYLTEYASSVAIIHRRDALRASRIIEEKARANPKIRIIWDSVVEEVKGERTVSAAAVRNVKTGIVSDIPCQGVFIFVGITPSTGVVKNLLHCDEQGFIITTHTATSQAGIFACGDCVKKGLYQVITAASEGAVAAEAAHKYLLNL